MSGGGEEGSFGRVTPADCLERILEGRGWPACVPTLLLAEMA